MQLREVAQLIKDFRIVSIASLIFISTLLYQFLYWVMTSEPDSLGQGVAITGIMASLVAAYKFIFEFASFNSNQSKDDR